MDNRFLKHHGMKDISRFAPCVTFKQLDKYIIIWHGEMIYACRANAYVVVDECLVVFLEKSDSDQQIVVSTYSVKDKEFEVFKQV